MAAPSRMLGQGVQFAMAARQSSLPPAFLMPSFFRTQASSFSTSSPTLARKARRDMNKNRGVSALRSTGLRKRQVLSVKMEDLPQPLPKSEWPEAVGEANHGLWGFFNRDRLPFATPEYDGNHGRAWTVEELRSKDWEDLHRLWWVCSKEKNRLATEATERERVKAGYGAFETEERLKEVLLTQRAIKHVLTERWYAWEDARKIAASDPSVNLNAGPGENEYDESKDPEYPELLAALEGGRDAEWTAPKAEEKTAPDAAASQIPPEQAGAGVEKRSWMKW